jgi:hypothetical protein
MIKPTLTYKDVKFFLDKFKNGDANDLTYRRALVDTFINSIFVYDDEDGYVEIYCNASTIGMKVPLDKPFNKGSSKGQLARRRRFELPTFWSVDR